MRARFTKGDSVEVKRTTAADTANNTAAAAFYPAIVLRSPSMNKKLVLVEYENRTIRRLSSSFRIKEFVELTRVRPLPPRELNRWFKVGDEVDAYNEGEGCWVKGNVREILENSRYVVGFNDDGEGGMEEVDQFNLRLHREWDDGSWIPPLQEQENSSETELRPRKMKLKIRFSNENPQVAFQNGMMVEVTSNEEGYKGSWYSATIVASLGNRKFLVEYLTLKTDDETMLLKEVSESQYIRPYPPQLSPVVQFKRLDEVDAWYNEGWWVGTITRVLNRSKYIVYFSTTNEAMEFTLSNLRRHQDWTNGKWVIPSKEKVSSELKVIIPRRQKLKTGESEGKANAQFTKGMKVEVTSDEKGYEGSWYSATIVNYIGNEEYIVEYQTLKTDDETKFLREEAKASDIRPCPPPIQRVYSYELLEYVDAWFNEGWWVGQINKVFVGMTYAVYFKTTNEELEFAHSDLRPHQEWKDGGWVAASKIF